jgi:hypothetical protein
MIFVSFDRRHVFDWMTEFEQYKFSTFLNIQARDYMTIFQRYDVQIMRKEFVFSDMS